MRRYERENNAFQSVPAINDLLSRIQEKFGREVTPHLLTRNDVIPLLHAAQNSRRRGSQKESASKRGRRSKFSHNMLVNMTTKIEDFLDKASNGKISLARFVTAYLPVLNYPPDIQRALLLDTINLEEARSLARINTETLPSDVRRKAVEIRRELLNSHLKRFGTQKELEQRVKDRLQDNAKTEAAKVTYKVAELEIAVDELLEFDADDTHHLLWEEIKDLVFTARGIDMSLIGDAVLEDLLGDLDSFKSKLRKYKPRTVTVVQFS